MKNNFFKSFRYKILMMFGISGALSGILTYVVYFIASDYYRRHAVEGDDLHFWRRIIGTIGDFNSALFIFVPLFFLCFIIITINYSRMLTNISKGISKISNGDFNVHIEVGSDDEIGKIAHDVNQAAKKLKESIERGEFAINSKDRMVIKVAHDLRTPLTSITGYLSLIQQNTEMDKDKILQYSLIAHRKALHLQKLLDELMEFAKFNYGEMRLQTSTLDLAYMLTQITDEFYPWLMERGMQSRLHIIQNPFYIEADGSLLARAVDNVISNAIKYGESGRYVDIVLSTDGKYAIITISNYDSLIPEEEQEKIFESFYRTEKSKNEDGDGARGTMAAGLGLGLSIVKNIVDLHNGRINIESNTEKTSFILYIPLNIVNS